MIHSLFFVQIYVIKNRDLSKIILKQVYYDMIKEERDALRKNLQRYKIIFYMHRMMSRKKTLVQMKNDFGIEKKAF